VRFVTRRTALVALSVLAAATGARPLAGAVSSAGTLGRLNFDVEWRLIRAGTVVIETGDAGGRVKIDSAGLVSTLFKVDDTYTVHYGERFCAADTLLDAKEGKRRRQATVTYDRDQGRAIFTDRDLVKNEIRKSAQTEVPRCVHEVLGGILTLRGNPLEPGQSTQLPMSNGLHSARVRVDAQEREEVRTPAGVFKTLRYEASLMNGVIYERKGRVFFWFTDDERRLPVQIRLRLPFPIGTVTLQLQKEEPQ
jgi:uncharacterized protein DUF3108